ncbi:MAG: AAA family ATPase [Anaerolineae bacterium]|nr:AAA family ATPase [Anaerolineae bacterium]
METQRNTLGDALVDAMIAAAREKLTALENSTLASAAAASGTKTVFQGERRLVTVVIADVKGSTQLLEHLGTEAWVELMNRLFAILEAEINRFGGAVDQFRGDGLVAFFGATETHEDDPVRAVLATLAMLEVLKPLAAELRARERIELHLRIGVNTGEVIVGSVGKRQTRRDDTAMGEAITIAARMEQAAEPGTVLVSENTYRLTWTQFKWRSLGTIMAKGVRRPIAVYRPLAAKATAEKIRGIPGLEAPLVGRQSELDALQQAIARLQAGEGGLVTIVGEAGLGKSRLVAELRRRVAGRYVDMQWVEGRCPSYGTSIAYLLWVDILRGLLDVAVDTPPPAIREALRARLQALADVRSRYPERQPTLYPYLSQLLGLPLDKKMAAKLSDVEGEELKRGTFRAIESLIESTARQHPLVIVCEDLHWADPTSLELLERLLGITRHGLTHRVPLLFICVLRPETAHGGALVKQLAARRAGRQHTDLWLTPLSTGESETLLYHLLRMDELPQQLKARILNHAEGNPFYIEELIRSLLDDGVIVWDKDRGRCDTACEPAEIAIPNTLYGVLMARIDRLPENAKRVLQLASVIGRAFPRRVLDAVNQNRYDLDSALLTLEREELAYEQKPGPEPEYVFRHHLIQEAAYNSLLKQERATLHQWVAEFLEGLRSDLRDTYVGLFAHHWERADRPDRAVTYLLRAGEQAAAQFANVEAAEYFSRALALTPGYSLERYTLLLARERIYDLMGAREARARDLDTSEKLAQALDDPLREAEIALRRANYAESGRDYPAAMLAAQKAIRLARIARDVHGEAAGYLAWGRALFYQGDYHEARRQLQQALDRSMDFPQVQADSLRSLGMVAEEQSEARDYFRQALHIHRKIGDRRGEWATLYNLSVLFLEQENCTQARKYGERALSLCRKIGDRQGERMALDNLGYVTTCQADYTHAQTYYEQTLRLCRKIGDRHSEGHTLVHLSALFSLFNQHDAAHAHAEEAFRLAQETEDHQVKGDALIFMGHALWELGRRDEATEAYREAHVLLTELGEVQLALDPLAGLARSALEQGDTRQALRNVEKILRDLDTLLLNGSEEFLRIHLNCWHVLHALRDRRANDVLATAHRALRRRAAKISDPEIQRMFLEDIRLHREIVQAYER